MPEIIPNWHPIFVHFTVALWLLAACLFVVARFVPQPLSEQWQTVARWSLWFGAGLTVLTGLTGLYAYNTVAHDTPSHEAMTEHRNWAVATMIGFFVLTVWSILWVRQGKALGTVFVVPLVIAAGLLVSTAWHGGELVYRYGLGVMALPDVDAHDHSAPGHAHGPGNDDHGHDDDHDHDHSHDATMDDSGMDFSGMDFDDMDEHAMDPADHHHDDGQGDHSH